MSLITIAHQAKIYDMQSHYNELCDKFSSWYIHDFWNVSYLGQVFLMEWFGNGTYCLPLESERGGELENLGFKSAARDWS